MARTEVVGEGLLELENDLAIAAEQAPKRLMKIMAQHGERMADEERERARPISRSVAESVEMKVSRSGKTVTFGPTSPLSHLFEFGTGPRFQKSTGRYTGIMSPKPFVEPVVGPGIERMLEDIADKAIPL